MSCSQRRKYSSDIIPLSSMIRCVRGHGWRGLESREIPTVVATFVAETLSAKRKTAVCLLDMGMRLPVSRRARMDLEATTAKWWRSSAVLLTDRHHSVAADMESPSDCANGMPPDEVIYYSLTNTKQAAFCVMAFRFGCVGMIAESWPLFGWIMFTRTDTVGRRKMQFLP